MVLSVVIAAYNEAPVIEKNLLRVIAELETRPTVEWEILCVNDGSSDKTGDIIDGVSEKDPRVRAFHHRRNFGQGKALRTAFDQCRGEIIVTLDADLSYNPEYVYQLCDALEENNVEIALASPYHRLGKVTNVPFYRLMLSRFGNYYLARMFNYKIATITCVVRAYRKEIIDSLLLTSNGMEMQLEILMKSSMLGYRVCEVPANLEWDIDKTRESDIMRVSKMQIMKTAELYLKLGWLQRPTYFFVLFSFLLLIPGIYTAILIANYYINFLIAAMSNGFLKALSIAVRELVAAYTPTIVFSFVFLFFGFQMLIFSLMFLQSKLNFEELFRSISASKHDKDAASVLKDRFPR
jgi:glycosyltransferase involved in cell wall biosynthesis